MSNYQIMVHTLSNHYIYIQFPHVVRSYLIIIAHLNKTSLSFDSAPKITFHVKYEHETVCACVDIHTYIVDIRQYIHGSSFILIMHVGC